MLQLGLGQVSKPEFPKAVEDATRETKQMQSYDVPGLSFAQDCCRDNNGDQTRETRSEGRSASRLQNIRAKEVVQENHSH